MYQIWIFDFHCSEMPEFNIAPVVMSQFSSICPIICKSRSCALNNVTSISYKTDIADRVRCWVRCCSVPGYRQTATPKTVHINLTKIKLLEMHGWSLFWTSCLSDWTNILFVHFITDSFLNYSQFAAGFSKYQLNLSLQHQVIVLELYTDKLYRFSSQGWAITTL